MKDASGAASEADLERLAARLAMLASDDGEADNAGRAVGAMARRIGLTGGDLKRMFLAGAAGMPAGPDRDQLEHEVSALRHSVTLLDADARRTAWERDALRAENGRLRASLDRLRVGARACGVAGLGVVLVLLAAGLVSWTSRPAPPVTPFIPQQGPGFRVALVRPGGALLFRVPERTGQPLAALPEGQQVRVRRLVWKSLFQWAEVEVPDGWIGYVLTTEINLS